MYFFDSQSIDLKDRYIKLLEIMGSLSNLFSESDSPFLESRVSENLFCLCLEAENLARKDCTADARKNAMGIGIKTWVGTGMQKIAEFNRLRSEYSKLKGEELAAKISQFRNDRIDFTIRNYNLSEMIYHCLVRSQGIITIQECPLEHIDINKIRVTNQRAHSTQFTDGIKRLYFQ